LPCPKGNHEDRHLSPLPQSTITTMNSYYSPYQCANVYPRSPGAPSSIPWPLHCHLCPWPSWCHLHPSTLCCGSWPLPVLPWLAPAHTGTVGPCLCHHSWPLPTLPRLAPSRTTTAAFYLHAASPALHFRMLALTLPSMPWCRYHIPPISCLVDVSHPFLILYILHKLCTIQVFLS